MKLIDLTNQKIGQWTVLYRIQNPKKGPTKWMCRCECGKEKEVFSSHLIRKVSTKCKDCHLKYNREKNHKQSLYCGKISGNFWYSIKHGASGKKANRPPKEFTITKEYCWELFLAQNERCAISGQKLEMNFCGNKYKDNGLNHTASLDRIDSSKGYVEGNVQWVHKDVNMMKRIYDQKYFIDTCKLIAEHNKDK